jgi:hypothetical protein
MKVFRRAQRKMHARDGRHKRKDRLTNYFRILKSQGVWSESGCWEEHRIAHSWIRLSFAMETLQNITILPPNKQISDTISRQSGKVKLTAEGEIYRRVLPNGAGREFNQLLYVADDTRCPDIVAGDDFMRAMIGDDDTDGEDNDSEGKFLPVSLLRRSPTKMSADPPYPEAQTNHDPYAQPTLYYRMPHTLQFPDVADSAKHLTGTSGSGSEGSVTQRSRSDEETHRTDLSDESGDHQHPSSTDAPIRNGHEIQHEFTSMVNWASAAATAAEVALDSPRKPSTSVTKRRLLMMLIFTSLLIVEIVVNVYAWWQDPDSELGRMIVVPWMMGQLQRSLTDIWFLVFAVNLFLLSGTGYVWKRIGVAALMELWPS